MYAITNTFKLDSSKIKSAIIHNFRTSDRFEEQIDYTMTQFNRVLFGPEEHLEKHINERLRDFKVRKNSVLVLETLLTASPEFFQQDGIDRKKLIDDWSKAALDFAKKEFGDNLVSAVLHMDEKTPHIHVMSLPITQDKRLSARDVNNRVALIDRQSGYAEAMKPFGLKRGEPVSTTGRKHQKLKDFYKSVNRAPERVEKPTSIFGAMKASDFERYQDEMNQSLYALRVQQEETERLLEQTRKANRELVEKNETLSIERRAFEKNMRGVDLSECVQELIKDGFIRDGKVQLTGASLESEYKNGEKVFMLAGKKVKNAIDMVAAVMKCGFQESIGYLKSKFEVTQVVNEYKPIAQGLFEKIENPIQAQKLDKIEIVDPKVAMLASLSGTPMPKGFDEKYDNETLFEISKSCKIGTLNGGKTLVIRNDDLGITETRHNGKSVITCDTLEKAFSFSGREDDKRTIFVSTLGDLAKADVLKRKSGDSDLRIMFLKTEQQWRHHEYSKIVIAFEGSQILGGEPDRVITKMHIEKGIIPQPPREQGRSRDLDFDR